MCAKINDRERQCIEYVLRKLYYSIKTDSPQNCTMKAIIISLKEDNIVNQLLISAVNRGGLWGIKRPACNLLLAAERKFREATVGPNVISIPSDTMAMRLLDDIHIRELYSIDSLCGKRSHGYMSWICLNFWNGQLISS